MRGKKYISKKNLSICVALMLSITAAIPGTPVIASGVSGTTQENNSSNNLSGVTPILTPIVTPVLTTEVTPTLAPETTVVPSPAIASPSPTMNPTEPTPTQGIPIEPTIPITSPPSPGPTVIPYRSSTLEKMASYDYVGKSITGISEVKETVKSLNQKLRTYGTLYGTGMPYKEYKAAMEYVWKDSTEYDKKTTKITVDITKTMNYDTYVTTLKKLSRYEGVYLFKIGTSTEGRDLYAVEIDMKSNKKKNVIMLTGQIHAREFGGGTFLVKELVDLVQKAQTDKVTMELLKKNKYVVVPIINVDGREALINAPSRWRTSGGNLWKAYTNGTDGGRNFPGLQWGQVAKGSSYKSIIANKPGYANFPGYYAGSCNETKAMMKWLYQYTIVEKASLYIDMHSQGSIIYAGKTWQTKKHEQKSWDLRTGVMNILNKGITRRKYSRVYESTLYGMKGEGSSLTDYAMTLAVGAKFSPAYGFSAFTDGKNEYILMQVKDLDQSKLSIKAVNPNFGAITLEIGYGASYLGNSPNTRRLLANEYNYYNYGQLLESLPKIIK